MNHPKLNKLTNEIFPKKWGYENIIVNNEEYCGKILHFNAGTKFSNHMHIKKRESFYLLSGKLVVTGINTEDASKYHITLNKGDILDVPRFCFHQIEALEDSDLIEFSTHHEDSDSYRVEKGDSQK